MRSVAFCWELGGGFGHVTMLRPLARFFQQHGVQVFVIARDLVAARRVFEDSGVILLQAPVRLGGGNQLLATPTFAHILWNVGYEDQDELRALISGWDNLLRMIRPQLIVTDHSPTALLAARRLSIPAVVFGTGFGCPPDVSPLPTFFPWLQPQGMDNEFVASRVLDHINSVLVDGHATPLERITQLYHAGPQRLLMTFRELDHYSTRSGEQYWGYTSFQAGARPTWPEVSGPRVFAYMKRCPQLTDLLTVLSRSELPVLVFLHGVDQSLRQRFEGRSLRFTAELLDLAVVGRECTAVVAHGALGTTTASLLSGKPVLSCPLQVEQALVAQAVERLQAGITHMTNNCQHFESALRTLVDSPTLRQAARNFAERYQDFDSVSQEAAICEYFADIFREIETAA